MGAKEGSSASYVLSSTREGGFSSTVPRTKWHANTSKKCDTHCWKTSDITLTVTLSEHLLNEHLDIVGCTRGNSPKRETLRGTAVRKCHYQTPLKYNTVPSPPPPPRMPHSEWNIGGDVFSKRSFRDFAVASSTFASSGFKST